MAKQLSFTDEQDNTYPAAYALITSVKLNKLPRSAELEFSLFRDKAARDSGKKPLMAWNATVTNIPGIAAVPSVVEDVVITPEIPEVPAVMDEVGVLVASAVPAVPAVMGQRIVTPEVPAVAPIPRFDTYFGIDVLATSDPYKQGYLAYAEFSPNFFEQNGGGTDV